MVCNSLHSALGLSVCHCSLAFCNKAFSHWDSRQTFVLFTLLFMEESAMGIKAGGKLCDVLSWWHLSQSHPSLPKRKGWSKPHPFLAKMAKATLHRNELRQMALSLCPPANMCHHYRCPCKWLQMALLSGWHTAAPPHWTNTGRKLMPEPSCVLNSSQSQGLINTFVSSVVFDKTTCSDQMIFVAQLQVFIGNVISRWILIGCSILYKWSNSHWNGGYWTNS